MFDTGRKARLGSIDITNADSIMETATDRVIQWKYDIGNLFYWFADEILEAFADKFPETPADIKYMENNVVKLWRLAEYSAKDRKRANLLLTLLEKYNESDFWDLVGGAAKGQEGNTS